MFPVRRKRAEDSQSSPNTRMKASTDQGYSSGEDDWEWGDSQGEEEDGKDDFIDFSRCVITPRQIYVSLPCW